MEVIMSHSERKTRSRSKAVQVKVASISYAPVRPTPYLVAIAQISPVPSPLTLGLLVFDTPGKADNETHPSCRRVEQVSTPARLAHILRARHSTLRVESVFP